MTGIWDERPNFMENRYWTGVHFGEFSRKFKSDKFKRDEDAWLEKLRAQMIDEAKHANKLIRELKEKAEKWDTEYQEHDALVKLQKIKAIVTEYGPIPEDMISNIEDIVEESVERELRAQQRLRHKLEMKLEAVREFVLSRRDDIEKDMENFGMLKPVLNYFLKEAEGQMTILEGYFAKIKDYPEDELKLCVASSYPFFVKKGKMTHYPTLAPSLRLLRMYKAGDIKWDQYMGAFKYEMLRSEARQTLEELKRQDKEGDVIRLLCYEKAEDKQCHRFILLDILSSMEEK